jgi:class 3 adenylate cyclase/pimeloyl-ACP methyl ester carboxylesterase
MEPRIQYARTSDGVSIAYFSMGSGVPFVAPPPAMPWSHIQMEWNIPEWRQWTEKLMRGTTVVRYDGRGAGLSDRAEHDCTLETELLDLEAVVDRIGLERFALFGCYHASPVTLAYAAKHPDRVSHLVLWCGFAKDDEADNSAQAEVYARLRDLDWEMFTETLAHSILGWSQGEPAHRLAEYMRASMTPEQCNRSWASHEQVDVSALLPQIQCPTLVMHRRDFTHLSVDVARQLASQIPDAHLAVLEGSSLSPYLGDTDAAIGLIFDFLGTHPAEADVVQDHGHQHAPTNATFRTILFSDVENSTALTHRLGDAQAREIMRRHERIVREALHIYGGSEIKTMGDGFMASFASATRAVECAVAIEREIARHNESSHEPVLVRVGLNAGEPIEEHDDLFGTSVIMASRIAAMAGGGEILASDVVRQLVAGRGFLFSERGEAVMRGFEDPMRVWEVRWQS